jgi:hypothetical protein
VRGDRAEDAPAASGSPHSCPRLLPLAAAVLSGDDQPTCSGAFVVVMI